MSLTKLIGNEPILPIAAIYQSFDNDPKITDTVSISGFWETPEKMRYHTVNL